MFGIILYIYCLYNGTGIYFINVAFLPSLEIAVIDTYINIAKNCMAATNPIKISGLLNSSIIDNAFVIPLVSSSGNINISPIKSTGNINAGNTHCTKYTGFLTNIFNSFSTYVKPSFPVFAFILILPFFVFSPLYKLPIKPLKYNFCAHSKYIITPAKVTNTVFTVSNNIVRILLLWTESLKKPNVGKYVFSICVNPPALVNVCAICSSVIVSLSILVIPIEKATTKASIINVVNNWNLFLFFVILEKLIITIEISEIIITGNTGNNINPITTEI